MTQSLALHDPAGVMERAVIQGDLTDLSPAERVDYYRLTCESLGLNPYTKPFEYLELDNGSGGKKLVLYARKDCTDQLRDIKRVSIIKLERERTPDLYIVTAHAVLPNGRTDSAVGAVAIAKEGGYWDDVKDAAGKIVLNDKGKPRRRLVPDGTYTTLSGEALANAIMKAETKAKRRVTLSICGLGMTDESEIDSIPGSRVVEMEYPKPSATDDGVTDADNRVWKRWLEVLAEAQGLGVKAPELRLPIALAELKDRANETLAAIHQRKTQLAQQETAAANGKAEHGKRAASAPTEAERVAPRAEATGEVLDGLPVDHWAENRRLVAEAAGRKLTGVPTLRANSGADVVAEANKVLAERIEQYDLDQIAARDSGQSV